MIATALDRGVTALASALAPSVVSVDGRSIEETIGQLLLTHRARVAVAESCTGGLVMGRLTDVAGSSEWFVGGVVAVLLNEVKTGTLGVAPSLIAAHGAVSEPVGAAMAEGVRAKLGIAVRKRSRPRQSNRRQLTSSSLDPNAVAAHGDTVHASASAASRLENKAPGSSRCWTGRFRFPGRLAADAEACTSGRSEPPARRHWDRANCWVSISVASARP